MLRPPRPKPWRDSICRLGALLDASLDLRCWAGEGTVPGPSPQDISDTMQLVGWEELISEGEGGPEIVPPRLA